MALSKLSELGGKVILGDEGDETIVPAKADGTAKASWLVGITAAGTITATDVDGNIDHWVGLLLPHYLIDVDGAITVGLDVGVVIPKSGHFYVVTCDDLNAETVGMPLNIGNNAGIFSLQAAVEGVALCRTYSYTDGDTVAIIIWN